MAKKEKPTVKDLFEAYRDEIEAAFRRAARSGFRPIDGAANRSERPAVPRATRSRAIRSRLDASAIA